ncbi:MAG: PIN domain-containing protein [Thermoanaerobaculia bacterium]
MSALVVDTSSWISYFAGRGSPLVDDALADGRVHLPAVVAAELLSGKLNARERADLEDLLSDLPLCGTDLPHWFRVGGLRASLLPRGISVSTPDAHVAQCALDLGASLLTEDRVFGLIARHTKLSIA